LNLPPDQFQQQTTQKKTSTKSVEERKRTDDFFTTFVDSLIVIRNNFDESLAQDAIRAMIKRSEKAMLEKDASVSFIRGHSLTKKKLLLILRGIAENDISTSTSIINEMIEQSEQLISLKQSKKAKVAQTIIEDYYDYHLLADESVK
jgi:predicted sugar kinase